MSWSEAVEPVNGNSNSSSEEWNRTNNLEALRAAALASAKREAPPPGTMRVLTDLKGPTPKNRRRENILRVVVAVSIAISLLNLLGYSSLGPKRQSLTEEERRERLHEELVLQAEDIEDHRQVNGSLPTTLSGLDFPPFGEGWSYERISKDQFRLSLQDEGLSADFDSASGLVNKVGELSTHQRGEP